jgi:carbamoyl-phosphate synthase large subunit
MSALRVLVTGAGDPDKHPIWILASDIQETAVGRHMSDEFFRLPPPEDSQYLTELDNAIKNFGIQAVIPQTTREIELLCRSKEKLEVCGAKFVLASENAIRRANDKYLVIRECEQLGIPFPSYRLVSDKKALREAINSLGYPRSRVVVKPRVSNGQRGVRIITSDALSFSEYLTEKPSTMKITLDEFLEIFETRDSIPDLIVSEYMPGPEYTVDMYRHRNHEVIIPRSRDVIRSGVSFKTTIDLSRHDIIDYSRRLAKSLDLEYAFGFQFKLDMNGVPKILESNPRVQGTMIASTFAGFNMIYYALMAALGCECVPTEYEILDKCCFIRYWGGIAVDGVRNELGRV